MLPGIAASLRVWVEKVAYCDAKARAAVALKWCVPAGPMASRALIVMFNGAASGSPGRPARQGTPQGHRTDVINASKSWLPWPRGLR